MVAAVAGARAVMAASLNVSFTLIRVAAVRQSVARSAPIAGSARRKARRRIDHHQRADDNSFSIALASGGTGAIRTRILTIFKSSVAALMAIRRRRR